MPEKFFIKQLANGLTLLGQEMDQVESAAMTLAVPAGSSYDPEPLAGAAAVAAEWVMRGAGDRDTRQLNDALDSLGCQHHENVQSEHLQLSSAQLGKNLQQVLSIYADVVRRPRLESESFESCRALTLQDLASLEDEPAQKCNMLLRERFFPQPLGRSMYGRAETLTAMTAASLTEHLRTHLSPRGTVLSVAGRFVWQQLCDWVEALLGDWSAPPAPPIHTRKALNGIMQVPKESAQAHIALAHRSVPVSDKGYYAARLSESILSGGMSGRLFTEVREKRGLVYHVSTRYHSLKNYAGMFTYAGTTGERAQQTLEVTVGELRRLGEGVTPQEMARSRTQLKSSLVMQGESTAARANMLASDWHHLGRLRSLSEISAAIDAVTADGIMEYLKQCPAKDFTLLTIGPKDLDVTSISE